MPAASLLLRNRRFLFRTVMVCRQEGHNIHQLRFAARRHWEY
jgi:hypothetical protein